MMLDPYAERYVFSLILCWSAFALLPLGAGAARFTRSLCMAALVALPLAAGSIVQVTLTPPVLAVAGLAGMLAALPSALLIASGAMFGEMFDWGRGQSIASLYDPALESSDTPMATLCHWGVFALYLRHGGLETLLSALLDLQMIVVNATQSNIGYLHFGVNILSITVSQLTLLFNSFLPYALLFLCVDIVFGFIARIIPGMGLNSESFQVKSALGVLALVAALRLGILSRIP